MNKRVISVLLAVLLLMLAAGAFAADYTYGSGERYTPADLVSKFEQLTKGVSTDRRGIDETDGDTDSEAESYVYVSADAFVIGGGFVMSPIKVELQSGDTAASVFRRAMEISGLNGEYGGSETNGFYLRSIESSGFEVNVEPGLEGWLLNNDIVSYYEPDSWVGGKLGEADITDLSGWMFYLNDGSPSVGMSDCNVRAGDVVSLRYSIAGGMDLGGDTFGGVMEPYTQKLDLVKFIRAIADRELNYYSCADIVNRAGVTQNEINDILRGI